MRALVFLLKLLLKIVMVPVILALTLFVWICVGIVYVSGLVLGLISMVIALLGVACLLYTSPAVQECEQRCWYSSGKDHRFRGLGF